ncbi:hypothetical protein B0T19DRAFT_485721 [Cercophora scortea]|uniref:DUF7587 domain-containing protein n=1 Tax=Cercophora scortea TaxID=314031 RepID=A0AAE0M8L4_9PEZI|nr:hypothetical protein B0T19DRAFT_485721 [Cercophora scortea]
MAPVLDEEISLDLSLIGDPPAASVPAEDVPMTSISDEDAPRTSVSDGEVSVASPPAQEVPTASVPVEEIQIVRWNRNDVRQDDDPDCEVWMARSEVIPGKNTRVWIKKDSPKLQEICHKYSIPSNRLIIQPTFCYFLKGRPLMEVATTIRTAGGAGRPKIVYRTVHDDHPFEGIKARGLGQRETDPLYFQWMLQRHLVWICRDESPFLSVTNDYDRALVMAAAYAMRSRTGVRILKIQTDGPGKSWDHKRQRMWHVPSLVGKLGLTSHRYFASEWVVENSIPAESVVRTEDWETLFRKNRAFFSDRGLGPTLPYTGPIILSEEAARILEYRRQKYKEERELLLLNHPELANRSRKRARGFVPIKPRGEAEDE